MDGQLLVTHREEEEGKERGEEGGGREVWRKRGTIKPRTRGANICLIKWGL